MSWAIITDSSCNLREFQPSLPNCTFSFAPLKIEVEGEEFIDDSSLDVDELNRRVALAPDASGSACPSAGEWAELFESAQNILAITVSSNLSGSYDAALMGRSIIMDELQRKHDGQSDKKIYVLDSKAAGAKLELMVHLIDRYLHTNPDASFDEVVAYAKALQSHSQVQFSLSSYDNLIKNGRMPKLVGALASGLSIRMLGTASQQGTIKVIAPTRGDRKTFRKIIETMHGDGYNGGMVYIDHVKNQSSAEALQKAILTRWPKAEIYILPCGGLCSYYAEASGLIVGYEWAE